MSTTSEQADNTTDGGIVKEIGHDEYSPIGTVILVALYFLIVSFMWVFMYFIEFLGNGPTVV